MTTVWAVVPVKAFCRAKQRLGACLGATARHRLARLMLEDVLDVLTATPALAGTLVVTADAEAAALARQCGASVLDEPEDTGLNPALVRAAAWLQERATGGMLVVPGDAPGLTVAEIAHLLRRHAQAGGGLPPGGAMSIAPAHDLCGTNALLLSPPQLLAPAFGDDSFRRHLQAAEAAGLRPNIVPLPGLALDLDLPRDLLRFASRHAAAGARPPRPTRTWQFLASCGMHTPPAAPAALLTRSRPCPAPSTLRTAPR